MKITKIIGPQFKSYYYGDNRCKYCELKSAIRIYKEYNI